MKINNLIIPKFNSEKSEKVDLSIFTTFENGQKKTFQLFELKSQKKCYN